jgi:hypothetical protein
MTTLTQTALCAGVWVATGLTAGLVFLPGMTRLVNEHVRRPGGRWPAPVRSRLAGHVHVLRAAASPP